MFPKRIRGDFAHGHGEFGVSVAITTYEPSPAARILFGFGSEVLEEPRSKLLDGTVLPLVVTVPTDTEGSQFIKRCPF